MPEIGCDTGNCGTHRMLVALEVLVSYLRSGLWTWAFRANFGAFG